MSKVLNLICFSHFFHAWGGNPPREKKNRKAKPMPIPGVIKYCRELELYMPCLYLAVFWTSPWTLETISCIFFLDALVFFTNPKPNPGFQGGPALGDRPQKFYEKKNFRAEGPKIFFRVRHYRTGATVEQVRRSNRCDGRKRTKKFTPPYLAENLIFVMGRLEPIFKWPH